jgi:hypothetical protein
MNKQIQGLISALLLLVVAAGLVGLGWFGRQYLTAPDPTKTREPDPPGSWTTATVWPTVAVQDLPFGLSEDPIEAARTAVPTRVSLMEIFQYDVAKANEYWAGFRPSYKLAWITTAGAEAVSVASAHESLVYNIFFWNWEVPGSRLEVASTVRVGVLIATSRNAVYQGLVFDIVDEDSIVVKVTIPEECAVVVAVPIPGLQPGQSGEVSADVVTDRISVPNPWLDQQLQLMSVFYNETELGNSAEKLATNQALSSLLGEDRLHQQHVDSLKEQSNDGANATVIDIARSAACFKLEQFKRGCDDIKLTFNIQVSQSPERLLWCGTGYMVMDVSYAQKHVDLSITAP